MIRNYFFLNEAPDVLPEQVMLLREDPPCPDVHQRLGHWGLRAKGGGRATLQVLHSGKRELRGKLRILWSAEGAGHYIAYCHRQHYLHHSIQKHTALFSSNVHKVCPVQEAPLQKISFLLPYSGPVWRSSSPSQRKQSYLFLYNPRKYHLVPTYEQFPNYWRYHEHLHKQLCANMKILKLQVACRPLYHSGEKA